MTKQEKQMWQINIENAAASAASLYEAAVVESVTIIGVLKGCFKTCLILDLFPWWNSTR